MKEEPEKRFFHFGNSVRYLSLKEVVIPFRLGKMESKLYISIVNAKIPLLIGKSDLKKFGFIINFEDKTVFTTRTFKTYPLETTKKGHLALPIVEQETLDDEIFLMTECERKKRSIWFSLILFQRILKSSSKIVQKIIKKF